MSPVLAVLGMASVARVLGGRRAEGRSQWALEAEGGGVCGGWPRPQRCPRDKDENRLPLGLAEEVLS